MFVGVQKYGSLSLLLSRLDGKGVVVQPSTYDVGKGKPGESVEARFEITNLLSKPVKVLGADAECSCVKVLGLPVVVPAGESLEVIAKVTFGESGSRLRVKIVFFTDVDLMVEGSGNHSVIVTDRIDWE